MRAYLVLALTLLFALSFVSTGSAKAPHKATFVGDGAGFEFESVAGTCGPNAGDKVYRYITMYFEDYTYNGYREKYISWFSVEQYNSCTGEDSWHTLAAPVDLQAEQLVLHPGPNGHEAATVEFSGQAAFCMNPVSKAGCVAIHSFSVNLEFGIQSHFSSEKYSDKNWYSDGTVDFSKFVGQYNDNLVRGSIMFDSDLTYFDSWGARLNHVVGSTKQTDLPAKSLLDLAFNERKAYPKITLSSVVTAARNRFTQR